MSSRNSSRGRGRFRPRRNRDGFNADQHGKTEHADVNESSDIIKAFRGFQKELDSRNDRHERIVKLSRDITIESKRLIFLLQRVAGSEDREKILEEAASKMKELHTQKFLALANELEGQDPYRFLRAFSPGLQEYIEAVTFYHYLANENLLDLEQIQSSLVFPKENTLPGQPTSDYNKDTKEDNMKDTGGRAASHMDGRTQDGNLPGSQSGTGIGTPPSPEQVVSSTSDVQTVSQSPAGSGGDSGSISVPIPPSEYMLGVADFTGELMRMAINSVGAGDLDTPRVVTDMMRVIHDAFSTFANTPRELRQKTRVLRQSLQKVETACYTLKVRGSEIPQHMLADVFTAGGSAPNDTFNAEECEEFYD